MNKEESERLHLFPVFLFIGMGVGFLLIESVGGLGFVSAMFVGMGLGFLFDSLVVIEEKRLRIEIPTRTTGIAVSVIGCLFIIGGVTALIMPDMLEIVAAYLVGLGFIALGIFILMHGLGLVRAKPT